MSNPVYPTDLSASILVDVLNDPQANDIVIGRHRTFDAFMGTDMDTRLKERGIEKVVLAGLTSQTPGE